MSLINSIIYKILCSYIIGLCCLLISCDSNDDFFGRSISYELVDISSSYQGGGTILIREQADGAMVIDIQIQPTGSGGLHPAHLHYGTYDTPDGEMAALLNPVDAQSGFSSTELSQLLDGTAIDFQGIMEFDGSIKIHMDDGANKKVVLAAANIGINSGT